MSISFIIFLVGCSLVLAGKQMTRALLFPMLFLFTMIPVVPNSIINTVAFPIQLNSAKLATVMLNVLGLDAVRNGVTIRLPDYTLAVELPCSGFKTLIGLLSFAGAFAYLVQAPRPKQWAIFLFSAPLAVVVNALRIALIGIVGQAFSARAAQAFHDYSGFIVLILGFMALFSFARLLRCESFLGIPLADPPPGSGETPEEARERERRRREAEQREMDARYGPPRQSTLPHLARGLYPVIGLLALACVGAGMVRKPHLQHPILRAEDVPKALGGGGWTAGEDIPIQKDVQDLLQPLTWINRTYLANFPKTGAFDLLISGGNNRHVFHDPHECFMGNGFLLHDRGVRRIETPAGPLVVQETVAERMRDKSRELMMFVYVVEGEQIQTPARLHARMMWQAVFGESGRPSYFVRFRQWNKGDNEERRRELIEFARAVWSEVGPLVTAKSAPLRTAARAPAPQAR